MGSIELHLFKINLKGNTFLFADPKKKLLFCFKEIENLINF